MKSRIGKRTMTRTVHNRTTLRRLVNHKREIQKIARLPFYRGYGRQKGDGANADNAAHVERLNLELGQTRAMHEIRYR